jgi:7,8-didemethyl-8-hydroxy-5-deazariboflavin synthase CofG subunit
MARLLSPQLPSSLLTLLAKGRPPSRSEAYALAQTPPEALPELMAAAEASTRTRVRQAITFSRSAFVPLTNICRDYCSYCTFRKDPGDPGARIMTRDEVMETVRRAASAGCLEILFSLGDKPEAFAWTREVLGAWGYRSILEYLADLCEQVVSETGLFPHSNAGVLGRDPMQRLRRTNVSMGLMLESTSTALLQPGGAHDRAPDKLPRRRLQMIESAGQLKIPFTTGMLVGIGERPDDWVETLFAIKELQERCGHIQEVIIQNFKAKPGTPMALHAEPDLVDYLKAICLSRFILGPEMNIQAPPNLNPVVLTQLLGAGVNDFGGVSPITIDFINPEAPWPGLTELEKAAHEFGWPLRERLPVYPEYLGRPEYLDPALLSRVLAATDSEGYVVAN